MPFNVIIANKNHSVSRNSIKNILTANSKTETLNARSWTQWFTDGCKYIFTLNMSDTHFKQINKLWDNIRKDANKYKNTTDKLCFSIIKLRTHILDKDKNLFDNSLRIKLQPSLSNIVDNTIVIKLYFVDNNENPIHTLSEFPLNPSESFINNENLQNRNFFRMFKKISIENFEDIFKIFPYNLQEIRDNIEKTWNELTVTYNNPIQITNPIHYSKKKNSLLIKLELATKQLEDEALNFKKNTEKISLDLTPQLKSAIINLKIITNQNRSKKNIIYTEAHDLKTLLRKHLKKIKNGQLTNSSLWLQYLIDETEELLKTFKIFLSKINQDLTL